ncbi:MAG: putative cysteine desulfurase [Magnetococcales bacterium]|nr:putative cysteine desulfurase [Magnetococcales bacterium]HIJ84166.1 aminotransferase class V-fold PLP-dependent enzyme [Magnetococcales bacterium]
MELQPSPFRKEFTRNDAAICLNHAGISPIPQRTARVITHLADLMTRQQLFRYSQLENTLEQARIPCSRLLGCHPHEVAFTRNTSEALSMVALGLDWQAGDEIVTTDQEFPSNLVVWLDLARRKGIKVHQVASQPDHRVAEDALLAHCNQRTRILTVSSVQFGTGATVDLEKIGSALKNTRTLFVVDAVQSLGARPLDVHAMGIDALAAGGHKWMLAPEGCGLFYLSEKGLASVEPRIMGWHSVSNAGDYANPCITPRSGIRRFEAGTHNVIGAAALAESITMLLEAGLPEVWNRIRHLTGMLIHNLQKRGCQILSPLDSDQGCPSGILVFSHPQIDPTTLHRHLLSHRIEQVPRAGGLRFAPHFYQDETDVLQVMWAMDRPVGKHDALRA